MGEREEKREAGRISNISCSYQRLILRKEIKMIVRTFRALVIAAFIISFPFVSAAAIVEVTVNEAGYNPSSIIINKGDTVRWINTGNTLHSVTSGEKENGIANGHFDSGGLNPGVTYEMTFPLAGNVRYFDIFSTSGVGSIAVDDNKIVISPSSSILINAQSFDLVIYGNFGERLGQDLFPLRITITFDGVVLIDSDYEFFLVTDPATTIRTLDGGRAKKFPISPYTLSPGVHVINVKIITASGQVISDEATYTVLEEGSFSASMK